MRPEQLFVAINRAIIADQCVAENYTDRRGNARVRYRDGGEPCIATYACRYPKRRILEIGRDILKALNVSEAEHAKLLEGVAEIYDSENSAESLGCAGSPEDKKKKLVRNVAIGAGLLTAAGVGSYFLFFRG